MNDHATTTILRIPAPQLIVAPAVDELERELAPGLRAVPTPSHDSLLLIPLAAQALVFQAVEVRQRGGEPVYHAITHTRLLRSLARHPFAAGVRLTVSVIAAPPPQVARSLILEGLIVEMLALPAITRIDADEAAYLARIARAAHAEGMALPVGRALTKRIAEAHGLSDRALAQVIRADEPAPTSEVRV